MGCVHLHHRLDRSDVGREKGRERLHDGLAGLQQRHGVQLRITRSCEEHVHLPRLVHRTTVEVVNSALMGITTQV